MENRLSLISYLYETMEFTKLTVIIISWCTSVKSLCYTYIVLGVNYISVRLEKKKNKNKYFDKNDKTNPYKSVRCNKSSFKKEFHAIQAFLKRQEKSQITT